MYSLESAKCKSGLFEVCIVFRDIPEALASAIRVLADANVNLKTGSIFHVAGNSGLRVLTSFIDTSKVKCTIEELVKHLRGLNMVVDVVVVKPKPAPFESVHFPILHGTTRAALVPIGIAYSLWKSLEEIFLPSGLAAIFYSAGKNAGIHTAKRLKQKYNLEKTDLILAFAQSMRATGWGIIEPLKVDFRESSATIIIRDCFEAVTWRQGTYKVCHLTRGTLAGFMGEAFNRPVEAEETKCKATGDDYCEFKISL